MRYKLHCSVVVGAYTAVGVSLGFRQGVVGRAEGVSEATDQNGDFSV